MKRLILLLLVAVQVLAANIPTRRVPFRGGGGGGGGPACTPAYENTGGTGDRRTIITVSASCCYYDAGAPYLRENLVDGDPNVGTFFNAMPTVGVDYLRFDFGSAVTINEAKFYQYTSQTLGQWKFQGSGNASSWTDIGSAFVMGGTVITITELSANTTAYRYYQILCTDNTGINGGPLLGEWEFKICGL